MSFPTESVLQFLRNGSAHVATEFEHLYAQLAGWMKVEHKATGAHKDVTADSYSLSSGVTLGTWTSVPHATCTFTAQSGTWTVGSADLSYLYYARLGAGVMAIRGAILSTSVSATPTELRLAIAGLTFSGNDAFGVSVYSENSFSTQDVGQCLARATNEWIAFKPRTGGTWATTTDATGVIFSLIAQVSEA